MKKEFGASVFGLATLKTNIVFAQSDDIVATPMSEPEFAQLQYELAAKETQTNSGYNCVKRSKTPSIYMFNYRMYTTTLESGFTINKMDNSSVYMKIT
ncbi:MAG: hypothetical protein JNL11_09515 [Bdellovibrionaceae bacterium]|nr:hypothetical protein [Pseudobdellovibrionaceae bacterium]